MSARYTLYDRNTPPETQFVPKGPRWSTVSYKPEYSFPDLVGNYAPPPDVAPPTVEPPDSIRHKFSELFEGRELITEFMTHSATEMIAVRAAQLDANAAFAKLDKNIYEMSLYVGSAVSELEGVRGDVATLFSDIAANAIVVDGLTSRMGSAEANIATEIAARTTLTDAFAGQITALNASLGTTNANLTTEIGVRANQYLALAASVTTLSTQLDGMVSQISIEAYTRSTLTDTIAATINTLQSTVAGYSAVITSEAITRASADSALGTRIDNITVASGGATASIDAEAAARVAGDTALTTQINSLTTIVNGNVASIVTEQATRSAADIAEANARTVLQSSLQGQINSVSASITTEAATRATQDTALAATATSLQAQIDTNSSSISTESIARSTQDSALAASISSVTTTVNGHTASISSLTSSVNGISASWTLAVSLDGSTGLMSFSGVKNPNGTTTFGLEIYGGLIVHGSVVIDGSLTNSKAANESFTAIRAIQVAAGSFSSASGNVNLINYTFNLPISGPVTILIMGQMASTGGFATTQWAYYFNGASADGGSNSFWGGNNISINVGETRVLAAGNHNIILQANTTGSANYTKTTAIVIMGSK